MTQMLDGYFWSFTEKFEKNVAFEYREIGHDITIKKPVINPYLVDELLKELRKERERFTHTPIDEIIDTLLKVIEQWKYPGFEKRRIALKVLPLVTGFSAQMITRLISQYVDIFTMENAPFFESPEPANYRQFHPYADGFLRVYNKKVITYTNCTPRLIGHISAGNATGLPAFEIAIDKLLHAASWLQVSTEEPILAVLFAQTFEKINPDIARTISVFPFNKLDRKTETILFRHADIVRVVSGTDVKHLAISIQSECNTPIAGHWENLSFCAISKNYAEQQEREIAELLSLDVSAWDQQGCFSPRVVFVEQDNDQAFRLAGAIAEEMKTTNAALPKGTNAGKIQVLDEYQRHIKKKMAGEDVTLFSDSQRNWLVIHDPNSETLDATGFFRVIKIKPIRNILAIATLMHPLASHVQTIGIAIPQKQMVPFANAVTKVGISNIRMVGSMPFPKLWEPWDGRFQMKELIENDGLRWASVNFTDMDEELAFSLKRKRKIVQKHKE